MATSLAKYSGNSSSGAKGKGKRPLPLPSADQAEQERQDEMRALLRRVELLEKQLQQQSLWRDGAHSLISDMVSFMLPKASRDDAIALSQRLGGLNMLQEQQRAQQRAWELEHMQVQLSGMGM